jgi:hypothetical protein
MKFHFAAVPVHGSADAQREMNAFLGSHRVLGVERHLVADGAQSVWAICVSYTDATSHHTAVHDTTNPGRSGPGRKERVDYKEVLGELELATFAQLREWRKRTADHDGIPPYAVFTNEQLAEIARRPVQTFAGLAAIDGVGAARVEIYGQSVLEILRVAPRGPAPPPAIGRRMRVRCAMVAGCSRGRQRSNRVNRGGSWNSNARNVRAANRNANTRGNRNDNLGFRLAGAQTQARAECNGSAPDQTAVATGGVCRRRTPTGPRRASSGSGCAVERSPGLRLLGSRTWWP